MRALPCLLLLLGGCGAAASSTSTSPASGGRGQPQEGTPNTVSLELGSLAFERPAAWETRPPTSKMRLAELLWPSAHADEPPAECVVYYFGPGGAGAVRANVDRWIGQIELGPGELHDVGHETYGGLAVTTVRLTGRYIAETRPGSGERRSVPEQRLLGAIVEAREGPYYFKVVGPEKTVRRWESAFDRMLSSVREREGARPPPPPPQAVAHPAPAPEPEPELQCPAEAPERAVRTQAERGPITVRGLLSHRVVFPVLEAHKGELADCVASVLERNKRADFHIRLELSGEGKVHRLRLETSPEGMEGAELCMACAARSWIFPEARDRAPVVVDAPFSFRRR